MHTSSDELELHSAVLHAHELAYGTDDLAVELAARQMLRADTRRRDSHSGPPAKVLPRGAAYHGGGVGGIPG